MPGMQRVGPLVAILFVSVVSTACTSSPSSDEESVELARIPGCGASNAGVIPPMLESGPLDGGDAAAPPVTDEASLFAVQIEPNIQVCRACHVAGGVADTDAGDLFQLAPDGHDDHDRVYAAWTALGKGVDTNLLLLKPSNTAPMKHTGGTLFHVGGAVYDDMKILLSCWDDPGGCPAQLASVQNAGTGAQYPLLGDLAATGGRSYAAAYCEGRPDCANLPQDPRELIAGANLDNAGFAVYFNDPFETCVNDRLLATQKKQNELLDQKGSTAPRYTAKARPKNCGEWRAAVNHGREYIRTVPISGGIMAVQSLVNSLVRLGIPLPQTAAEANASLASIAQQRYGWPPSPYPNPAPFPGEDANKADGGSLQLPIALAQEKDAEGKWTGKIGLTCFACHTGQIGTGEVLGNHAVTGGFPEIAGGSPDGLFLGLNGANTDGALALSDTDLANGLTGPTSVDAVIENPSYLAARTRGTNAADELIASVLGGRNPYTLDFLDPSYMPQNGGKTKPSLLPVTFEGGDEDQPAWWWTHNKSRYLWTGFGSNGSVRGNMFAGTANPYDGHWSKHREGDFQDLDQWLNTIEAPKFVGPAIDAQLAEEGAILFHSKDLWADPANADIPRPSGNGACAGCHGAYSPRYIHQAGYLPDTRLGGMTGYTVPLAIVGTDSASSDFFNAPGVGILGASGRKIPSSLGNGLWMSYPDANAGYIVPESRTTSQPPTLSSQPDPDRVCGLGTLGGYVAQSLHGVWASAPYFHNGSVPTVWDVLKPSDRPTIWRRQQIPASEAAMGYRGYDTNLARAYDYVKLGWKYATFDCDPSSAAAYNMTCQVGQDETVAPGPDAVDDRTIYNTNAYSKGNHGHEYTKVLTDDERRALIEYLKTL
jgi:mono/diheme cytochrome c family protein